MKLKALLLVAVMAISMTACNETELTKEQLDEMVDIAGEVVEHQDEIKDLVDKIEDAQTPVESVEPEVTAEVEDTADVDDTAEVENSPEVSEEPETSTEPEASTEPESTPTTSKEPAASTEPTTSKEPTASTEPSASPSPSPSTEPVATPTVSTEPSPSPSPAPSTEPAVTGCAAGDHDYRVFSGYQKDPSTLACGERTYAIYKCSGCDSTWTSQLEYEEGGHRESYSETIQPTCLTMGKTIWYCECGTAMRESSINALPCVDSDNDGYCDMCKDVM